MISERPADALPVRVSSAAAALHPLAALVVANTGTVTKICGRYIAQANYDLQPQWCGCDLQGAWRTKDQFAEERGAGMEELFAGLQRRIAEDRAALMRLRVLVEAKRLRIWKRWGKQNKIHQLP